MADRTADGTVDTGRVRLGVIVGAHGVRGQVRVKTFTARAKDIAAYGPVTDEAGTRTWRLSLVGTAKGVVLARLEGVTDRTAAEALKGTPLCVDRAALPPVKDEDEYYHADLVGLAVRLVDGEAFGRVTSVHDFGAGDVLEVRPDGGGKTVMIPFTRAAVPTVDLPDGYLTVADVPGLLDSSEPDGAEGADRETGADDE